MTFGGVPLVEVFRIVDRELCRVDAPGVDAGPVVEALIVLERKVAAAKTSWVGRLADQEAYRQSGHGSAGEWLADKAGVSKSEADKTAKTAERLKEQPEVAKAFAQGKLSPAQAGEIARGVEADPTLEGELLEAAGQTDLRGLRNRADRAVGSADKNPGRKRKRIFGDRSWRSGVREDGTWWGSLSTTADIGARLDETIRAATDRLFDDNRKKGNREARECYAADAVTTLITRQTLDESTGEPPKPGGKVEKLFGDLDLLPHHTGTPEPASEHPAETVDDEDGGPDGTTPSEPTPDDPDPNEPDGGSTDGGPSDSNSGVGTGGCGCGADVELRKWRRDLIFLIDLNAYRRGQTLSGELCEIPGVGPVPVEIAGDLTDDPFVKAVICDGTDIRTVAHYGRSIPAKLRTALQVRGAMNHNTCTTCGRSAPRLEYDHIEPHATGGQTSLQNLEPKCETCHQQKTTRDRSDGKTHNKPKAKPASDPDPPD